MKKSFSIFLSLIMMLTITSAAIPCVSAFSANTYYIDSINGSNENKGNSPESAWKDLGGFSDETLGAGDKVLFRAGGTYDFNVTLTGLKGTEDAPFVISSYGEGERPILTTNLHDEVFTFIDCSYITVSDVQITAPNGGGIWIDTINEESIGICIENVYFFGMPNGKVNSRDDLSHGAAGARAAVVVKGLPANSRYPVNDLTITGCEVYDSANGFLVWGSWNDQQNPWCDDDEKDPVYNTGLLIADCYFHEMDAEAVIVGICDGALVTHCRAINTCQGEGVDENGEILYFTAAMWFWGSENSIIQYCEIAGQKNVGDGMTVDFDSGTNNCTYQYIYSHDNQRFVVNNAKDDPQKNNTVRYCLSVNDNKGRSSIASGNGEDGLKFYNNTIINCGEFQFYHLLNSFVANNIIIPMEGEVINFDLEDEIEGKNTYRNNCYYNTLNPGCDLLSMNTLPGFTGGEGIDAYKLAVNSPLIGKGTAISDGLTVDFYGNEITSTNIGCYMGNGEEPEAETENCFIKFFRTIKNIFDRIMHEINIIVREAKETLGK